MNNRLKVLFVYYAYPGIGGVETVSSTLIAFLKKHMSVYFLAFKGDLTFPTPLKSDEFYYFPNIEDERLNQEYYNGLLKKLSITHVVNQNILHELSPIVFNKDRDRSVKIISCLHSVPRYEEHLYWRIHRSNRHLKMISRKLRSKIGLIKPFREMKRLYSHTYEVAAKESEKIVLLCEPYIEEFISAYHLEEYRNKITWIFNPVKPLLLSTLPFEQKTNTLLYVGRLSFEKRVDMILKVWSEIQNQTDWNLQIVGEGDERSKLEQLARDLSLERVGFCGQTTSPEEYFRKAKAVLLTSIVEGFGLVLVEGQYYGTVPICFNISKGVEIIVGENRGILVKQNDGTKLAKELLRFIKNESMQKELSERVQAESRRFSIEEVGKQWLSLLK